MKINKYRIIYTVLFIAMMIIIILFFLYYKSMENKAFNIFSQEEWNKNTYTRAYMIDDLLLRYNFIGMSKNEVISILGNSGLTVGNETLRYDMHGGILNDEILQFVFDKNERIIDIGIAN